MDELVHRFLVAAIQHSDLRRSLAAAAGQLHLAAAYQHAVRRAQTRFQGSVLLVGERTNKAHEQLEVVSYLPGYPLATYLH